MTRFSRLASLLLLTAAAASGCVVTTGSPNTELQLEVYWDNTLGSYVDCTTAVVDDGTEYFLYYPGGSVPVVSGRTTPCGDTLLISREQDGSYLYGSYDIVVTGLATDGTVWRSDCGTVSLLNGVVNIVECDADVSVTELQIEAYWDNDLGSFGTCGNALVDDGTDYYIYPQGSSTPVVSGQVFPCADTIFIDQEDSGAALVRGAYDIVIEGYATDGTEWYVDCGTVFPLLGYTNIVECDVPIIN